MSAFPLGVAAGTLAALNPCGFALLPAALALVAAEGKSADGNATGRGTTARHWAAVRRALGATSAITAGFLTVFAVVGLALLPVLDTVQRLTPVVTVLIGIAVVALSLAVLAGRKPRLRVPGARWWGRSRRQDRARSVSMYLFGCSYAIASLGCAVAPFLVLVVGALQAGDVAAGAAAFLGYASGMGLVVSVLAVATALATDLGGGRLGRLARCAGPIGGLLLLASGVYLTYYGAHELGTQGAASDSNPVLNAGGRLRQALTDQVQTLGPGVLALALGVMMAGSLAVARGHNRR